ncbi:MAG: hypothetical protein OXH90_03490 [Paracoccaceae bacterium]|nr:hypothetical protein [Paracoccaceae bacterium]
MDDASTPGTTENVGTYTIVLDSQPTADVVINLAIPDGAPFTAINDDIDNAGDEREAIITQTLTAGSSDYGSVTPGNVTITVTDDDTKTEGVTVSKSEITLTEGTGTDTYTVVLDSQPSHDVTITVTAPAGLKVNKSGGTAATSQTLTFSPTTTTKLWSTAQTITVSADQNATDDPSRRSATITHAAASNDTGYQAIVIEKVTATVADDDATTVTLTTPDTSATEGSSIEIAKVTLTLGRGLVTGETLIVPLAFSGGTPGTDFQLECPDTLPTGVSCQTLDSTPTVTFTGPDTDTTATAVTLTFKALDDAGSTDETVTVSIPAGTTGNAPVLTATGLQGGATGSRTDDGQITITDDDTEGVTVSTTSMTLQEIDDASTTGTAENVGTYTIVLDSQPTADVVINLAIPDGAPFTAEPTTLTFTPTGDTIWNTAQTVTLTAINDDIDNIGDQRQATITHTLVPGSSNYTNVMVDNVTITVTDDDVAASYSINDASATEGQAISFTVNRGGATGASSTVSWNTSNDGDGDHPASTSDYTPQPTAQTLSFAIGETSKTLTVQTSQDQIDEENETFLVILSAPSTGISISDGTAIGTITDDDGTPTGIALTVDADTGTENDQTDLAENGGAKTIRITATVQGGSTFPNVKTVTVEVGQATDSATEGTDYGTVTDQIITIPAGTTSAHVDFTLTPEDDNLDETDETITIIGSEPGGATVTATTITLNDDDTKGVTVTPTSLTLQETDDTSTTESTENVGTYTIKLDTQPTANVVINMTVPAGAPFSINPASLTFTPSGTGIWSTEQAVTVTAINDDIDNAGDQRQAVITHTIAAESTDYNSITIPHVTITVNDDDIPMVSYSLVSSEVVESDAIYPIMITIKPPSATDFMLEFQLSGTAQEGIDHEMKQEVMIPAGESPVETQIKILDDDIIEDDETVIMALMASPSYEYESNNPNNTTRQMMTIIDDDSPSENSKLMAAWQARFGREVAEHVLEGISKRIEAPQHAQSQVQIAGYPLDLNPTDATSTLESTPTLNNMEDHANKPFGSENDPTEQNTMTLQDAILKSSFTTMGHNDSTQESHAFWGQVSQSFFEGRENELSFEGEVTTAMLGADRTKGKWLVGVAVLQSTGEGSYSDFDEQRTDIDASLTAIVPYTSLAISERFRIWSALGYGNGWITYGSEPGQTHKADISWSLAAIGARSNLLEAVEAGDLEIAVVADAFWTATESEKTEDFEGVSGEVTKIRIGLEGTKEIALKDNKYLTPRINISIRHDGGDAETGWGVEVNAGINWHDALSGWEIDLSGWKLIAHTSDDFSDWGYSFNVIYDPNPYSKRGWTASYSQSFNGTPNDILNTLPQPDPFNNGEGGAISRQAEVSYGFPAFDGQYTNSPYIAVSETGHSRDLALGGRLSREHGTPDLDLGIMGKRSESNGSLPDYTVGLELITRW